MNNQRAFIYGVMLGVAGSIVPDVVTVSEVWKDETKRPLIVGAFGFMLAICLLMLWEVRK